MQELRIDKDFCNLAWALTAEEKALLAASLKEEGCREPVRYWAKPDTPVEKCPIVDGHHRYEICNELGIEFTVVGMPFSDKDEAIQWMLRNQLGRRNASDVQKDVLRGMLHIELKKVERAKREQAEAAAEASPGQGSGDVAAPKLAGVEKKPNLAQQVAEETGVSTRQVHRDTELVHSLERLAMKSPELRDAVLRGDIPKSDAATITEASIDSLRAITSLPQDAWKGEVKRLASALRAHTIDPGPGRPIVQFKELAELEASAGRVVRAKSEALKACGGKECKWAADFDESLRHALNGVFDVINSWKKEAARRRG